MKAILASVKPEWWEKMLSGEKLLEIRKSAPQDKNRMAFHWPLKVFVYVSGTGAVQGEFDCPGWIGTNMVEILEKQSCVPLEDLKAYAKGKSLYGWLIKSPHKYDSPKALSEFGLDRPPVSWQYVDISL